MTTAHSSRTSVGIAFATQYLEMAIQFAAVMVLARVLTPADTGTYTIAAFLMTLLHVFRDFGVVQYVIQTHELSREKIQNAMGVAILLALLVAGTLLSISGIVARFYGNPDIEQVLWVMSASFAVSPFGSVLLAIMRRENLLQKIFYIRMASAVCHVTVAISLAMLGYGALSLAWANFAGILAFGIVANLLRPPGLPFGPRFSHMRSILSFGGISSLGNAATMAGTNLPDMVIGKVMNMAAVGYFSRANGLVLLFSRLISGALTPLVLPYFAQLRRSGDDLRPSYLLAVQQLTAVAWPFFAGLALLAYPMVHVLYGAQWDASVPLVRLLCVAGAIAAVALFSTQVMVANGQVRFSTMSTLLSQPVRVVLVLVAATDGLNAVASVLIAAECWALGVSTWFLRRSIGLPPASLLRACVKSVLITLCSAVGPALVVANWHETPGHAAPVLMSGIAAAAVGWIGSIMLLRHPLHEHLRAVAQTLLLRSGLSGALGGKLKALAYHSGMLGLYHRVRNRNHLTIAMFHRVLPASDPRHAGADPEWTMTTETFNHCLTFFRRHYQVVTPEQVFAALRQGHALPPRSLLITFDDGWADTAEYAQPLLDQAGMRALVFVVGDAVDRATPFWEEYLYQLLATEPDGWQRLAAQLEHCGMAPLKGAAPANSGEAAIRHAIGQLSQRERPAVLAMVHSLGWPHSTAAMLSQRQLEGLVAGGHAIGGHGMSHQPLTRVTDLAQELQAAQQTLATRLQQPAVESMSFPHGAFSEGVAAQCSAAGYQFLFSSEAHLTRLDGKPSTAPRLGRIHISERALIDRQRRFLPSQLALWLFLRPVRPPGQAGAHHE